MSRYDPAEGYTTSVLVTGATGQVGRAVCRELVLNGYRVLGVVRNEAAKSRLPYAVVPVRGDIRNPEAWEAAIMRSQILVNLAILPLPSGRPLERVDAERQAEEMAGVLDRICTLVRRHKRRLIHTFSGLLYEPDPDGYVRESSAITSGRGFGARHRIVWPVLERHRAKGLKAICVNPGFVYGPGGWFETGLLIPMSKGKSTFIGDGNQTMHYVAAPDAAAGYRLAIEKGVDGEDYLLADDRPSTIGEFTRLVAREVGAPEPVSVPEETMTAVLGAWGVEACTYCPKIYSTKAKRRLGWEPRFPTIDDGVPILVREWKLARRTSVTA